MKILPLLLMAAASFSGETAERPMRRFLVAAASNDGGPGKKPLRFADLDARGVVATMRTMGGVSDDAVELLTDADTSRFLSALRDVSRRMAASKDSGYRVELMLYYSGHSDEEGLLLGGSKLRYLDLRRAMERSPADVRLAVLDACASGAALRTKGGVRRQAFHIEGADRLRGQAFLTSSRAEESSQESDRLEGSVFTHSFLAGLRGAADADADGRVTLLEAYRYAYRETVEKTSSTRVGPQHPEFDLDLSGSGDVVLTDIAQAGAILDLAGDLRGRVKVTGSDNSVAAELESAPGRNLAIGLPAGIWRVSMTDSVGTRSGAVELLPGSRAMVSLASLGPVEPSGPPMQDRQDSSKVAKLVPAADSAEKPMEPVLVPFELGFAPPVTINSLFSGKPVKNHLAVDLFAGEVAEIDGIQVSAGLARASRSRGIQAANVTTVDGSIDGIQASGLYGVVDGGGQGIQASGLAAGVAGPFRGIQATGLAGWSKGDFLGVQTSGLAVWNAADFQGVQAGGLASIAGGSFHGIQAGGLVSVSGGGFRGIQASGLVGWSAGEVRGIQVGSILAYDGAELRGLQAAVTGIVKGEAKGLQTGVFAWAGSVRGAQVSVISYSGSVTGAQVGVVNIAGKVEGAQVGVVNIAGSNKGLAAGVVNFAREFEAFPLGLVSLGANLRPGLDVSIEESGWGSAAFRMDGKRFHSLVGGTARLDDPSARIGPLAGFGAHWRPDGIWRLETDLVHRSVFARVRPGDWREASWSSLRVSAGRNIGPLRVLAGLSYNVLVSDRDEAGSFIADPILGASDSDDMVRQWPGAFVSVGI